MRLTRSHMLALGLVPAIVVTIANRYGSGSPAQVMLPTVSAEAPGPAPIPQTRVADEVRPVTAVYLDPAAAVDEWHDLSNKIYKRLFDRQVTADDLEYMEDSLNAMAESGTVAGLNAIGTTAAPIYPLASSGA